MKKAREIRRAEKQWAKVKAQLKDTHPWWFDYVDYR